jgi:hypothetical protein
MADIRSAAKALIARYAADELATSLARIGDAKATQIGPERGRHRVAEVTGDICMTQPMDDAKCGDCRDFRAR